MATTTQDTLSPQVQKWFNKSILATPEASYIHNKVADKYKLPRMMGGTMLMTRYTKLPSGSRLDGSGVDPAATNLEAVNIEVTPTFHGLYLRLEETVVLQRNDRVLSNAAERLGQSMRQTEDELTRDVLASTASILNCTGGTNGRIVAVLKSLLIDLELLPGNAGDNKAQASISCAA